MIRMPGGHQIGWVITANAVPDPHTSPDLMKKLDDEESTLTLGLTDSGTSKEIAGNPRKGRRLGYPEGLAPGIGYKGSSAVDGIPLGILSGAKRRWVVQTLWNMWLKSPIVKLFWERFQWIAPPMVEEIRQHIQEMLDGGAIHPFQCPWCNVGSAHPCKKDRSLWFCIDFRKLNEQTCKNRWNPWSGLVISPA